VLHDAGLRFDTRFTLHFYDMDWCRTAHEKGLRMGTIALSVVHQDSGNFNSRAWLDAYQLYLDKWIPQTLTP
jgi:GT2 family glycosyltransferase